MCSLFNCFWVAFSFGSFGCCGRREKVWRYFLLIWYDFASGFSVFLLDSASLKKNMHFFLFFILCCNGIGRIFLHVSILPFFFWFWVI